MNKILRFSFLAVLTMLFSMSYAQVTFDFDKDAECYKMFGLSGASSKTSTTGDFTESKTSTPKEGITLTVNPSSGKYANRIYETSPRLRLYGGSMNVASTNGKITKIVFKLNSRPKSAKWGATATVGNLTPYTKESSTEVTWTGTEQNVTLTVSSNTQIRFIEVYTANTAVTVAKPTFVGNSKFTTTTNVTINSAAGTTVYYTTNGNTPDENGEQYSVPFPISNTTTVKAIAYDGQGNSSEVAEMTYTKVDPIPTTGQGTEESPYTVSDICALNAAGLLPEKGVVTGTIYKVEKFDEKRGQINYYINTPGGATTDTMMVYGGLNIGGEKFKAITDLSVGDVVTVTGDIKLYNKLIEFNYGNKILKRVPTPSTSITSTKAQDSKNAPVYNVSGQRVNSNYNGIVIKNGKKYFQK